MSATTQPQTFSDLYLDLLQRVRQDRTATATAEQAKRYINTALYDMHIGFSERFPWAERKAKLITHPLYEVGTLALLAQGGTTLTGDGTLWQSLNIFQQPNARRGGKVRVRGEQEVYEVTQVVADAQITIDGAYLGASAVSGVEYTYYEDEYDLASDFGRPWDLNQISSGPYPITLVKRADFRRAIEGRVQFGIPSIASIVDRPPVTTTTPRRRVRLWPIPDRALQISYSYVTRYLATDSNGVAKESLSADTDEPIVPLRYRHAIVLHALYNWYRDKKDDTRSGEAQAAYEDILRRIAADTEIGSNRPRIAPDVAAYRMRSRRPWRAGLGRYDLHGRFDRLEDL